MNVDASLRVFAFTNIESIGCITLNDINEMDHIKKPQQMLRPNLWYHLESNQGHMDFQSIALPTELWYPLQLGALPTKPRLRLSFSGQV